MEGSTEYSISNILNGICTFTVTNSNKMSNAPANERERETGTYTYWKPYARTQIIHYEIAKHSKRSRTLWWIHIYKSFERRENTNLCNDTNQNDIGIMATKLTIQTTHLSFRFTCIQRYYKYNTIFANRSVFVERSYSIIGKASTWNSMKKTMTAEKKMNFCVQSKI